MGSFGGACEIVEEKDRQNSSHDSKRAYHHPHSGLSVDDKDLEDPVLKLGYKGSLEDDINQLFESISIKSLSKGMGPSNQFGASTSGSNSPLRRNALKKLSTGTMPRSPGHGISEPVSIKQALRDLCVSKASEMAAVKRLSRSSASPRISEAGRIKTLYNAVVTDKSGESLVSGDDEAKGITVDLSLMIDENKSDFSESLPQQLQFLKSKLSNQTSQFPVITSSYDTDIIPLENEIEFESKVENLQKAHANDKSVLLELQKTVVLSKKSGNEAAALEAGQKGKSCNVPLPNNSKKAGKLTRHSPRVAKQVLKNKTVIKKKIKQGSNPQSEEVDGIMDPSTNQMLCQRCHCALKGVSTEPNLEALQSTSVDHVVEVCSGNSNSSIKSITEEAFLPAPDVSHKAEDGLKNIPIKDSQDNINAEGGLGDETHRNITTEEAIQDAQLVSVSLSSKADLSGIVEKVKNPPKLRQKGEFSQSSKDSVGEYSSSTSLSEDSNASRPSFSNRPHMSKDVRWEAVRHVKMQHGSLGLRHFNLLKKLGCGDIGTVYLAELIGTNCLFAIKVMDIEFLSRRKKTPRAQTEREILRVLDHPFLPTLYAQFTSDNLACLVMEFCPYGDLHVLRQKQPGRCFPEPAARFYVAEVLLALEYLHMLGVIYRDLKPENILVRDDGHIMLTDFDLSLRCSVNPTLLISSSPSHADPARISGPCTDSNCIEPFCIKQSCRVSCFRPKVLPPSSKTRKSKKSELLTRFTNLPQLVAEPTDARSNSFVGTHEYLAPEIIKGEGHGAAVDWWTFGIFLYELLYGKTPFKGSNNEETLANVVLQSLKLPDSPLVSFQARDLIRGLLVKEPENRLGSVKGSVEIKQHPFFEGLNWALIRCAIPPELPDFNEFGVPNSAVCEEKYLECKAIGEHLEFELF